MQKIRKILIAVSEKTVLPTNQLLPTTPILLDLADTGPIKERISVRNKLLQQKTNNRKNKND